MSKEEAKEKALKYLEEKDWVLTSVPDIVKDVEKAIDIAINEQTKLIFKRIKEVGLKKCQKEYMKEKPKK